MYLTESTEITGSPELLTVAKKAGSSVPKNTGKGSRNSKIPEAQIPKVYDEDVFAGLFTTGFSRDINDISIRGSKSTEPDPDVVEAVDYIRKTTPKPVMKSSPILLTKEEMEQLKK